jgi:[acyl-carrier-protein] S-malonyltransferase
VSNTVFLFPGQGAQSVGMGRADYDALPAAREIFERAKTILGYDLADLCFNGPGEKLDQTEHSQPALFVTGIAALEVLRSKDPDLVNSVQLTAGLSLGEYTALVFAGVMTFEDGLRVVRERGLAMQAAADATPSGMASILGMDDVAVKQLCTDASQGDLLVPANYLCPGNVVISGTKPALERAMALATERGAMKTIPLTVAGAFHTSIMQPAVERLRTALAAVPLKSPRIPVISNVDATAHDNPEEIRKLLVEQVVNPVLWEATMRSMIASGITTFWEVGNGRILRGLLKRIDRKLDCQGTS